MKTTVVKAFTVSCGLLLFLPPSPPRALAGIPEPGIVLYGVVSDDISGSRITSGALQIIYRDQTILKAVTNVIALQDLGGAYSYVSEIQFESALTNQPVTRPDALELPAPTASARVYDVSAASTISPILTQTNRDTITFSQKGKLLRLDLVVVSDADHNGLPDAWELRYFGHLGVDPNADPNQDGMSNLREYLAGTDPNNANSALKLTGIQKALEGLTLRWLSATGKTYTVQFATNANGPFSANVTDLAATPPENSYLVAETNAAVKFFRISTP